jgi:endonuclease/exonuclease/phosphatase (EEP) superfamily protein YafD
VIALSTVSYIITTLVFLPLIRNNYWIFRSLEYPRFQKFLLAVGCLVVWGIYSLLFHRYDLLAIAFLTVATIFLSFKIWPYTILCTKEVKPIRSFDRARSIKIFAANVLQDNRAYDRMLAQIKQTDPDIVFLLETDKGWAHGMSVLEQNYPYKVLEPLDNTYGMLFYSRYKVEHAEVKYLVKDDVPSLDAIISLPDGTQIQLWGLHPEPPVPNESLTSTAKDKELMKIALKARDCKLPVIVMGDLNDVAWSYTTSLFTRTSQLLDVRKGRGFYSTFSAKNRLLRFPLDYIFCSNDFGLADMKRMPYNGSDHFPILTHLVYHPPIKKAQPERSASSGDLKDAKEISQKQVEPDSQVRDSASTI